MLGAAAVGLGMLVAHEPGIGFFLVVGGAVTLLAFKDLTWGLAAVAALSYLEAIPAVAGGGLSGSKLLSGMVVFAWFAVITIQPRARRLFWVDRPILTMLISLFLLWVLLSSIWAEVPIAALTNLGSFGLAALLFPVAYTALHDTSDVKKLLTVMVVFAFIAATYGFAIDPSASGASGGDPTAELNRLGGSIGDPNRFAAKVLPGAIVAISMLFIVKSLAARLFFGGTAVIGVVAVLLSLSRGGLIAAAVVCLVAPLVIAGARGRVALATCGAIALAIGALFVLTPPEARQRITESDGGNGRTDIWTVGWRMVEAHPANGVGAGNFEIVSIHYLIQPGAILRDEYFVTAPKVAHNSYLHVLAELGVLGLSLYLVIIGIAMGCLYKAAQLGRRIGDRELSVLAYGVLLGVLSALVANFFISEQLAKLPWLLLAIGPAMLAIANERMKAHRADQGTLSTSS
jgi:O-antigen ligase